MSTENEKSISTENLEQKSDEELQGVAGGHISYIICSTCGNQLKIPGRMGEYLGNNICPICHGLIKRW